MPRAHLCNRHADPRLGVPKARAAADPSTGLHAVIASIHRVAAAHPLLRHLHCCLATGTPSALLPPSLPPFTVVAD